MRKRAELFLYIQIAVLMVVLLYDAINRSHPRDYPIQEAYESEKATGKETAIAGTEVPAVHYEQDIE